jgi:hypothetical protein
VEEYAVELMKQSSNTPDRNLIIGIDFDNTIINYGNLFFEAGLSLGVLPDNGRCSKKVIRDYLIGIGREVDWTQIQGLVYGDYIRKATIMEGFSSFSHLCYDKGWKIFIISHKTREPIAGERFNLHTSALRWLETNRIYSENRWGAVEGVFFEVTQADKIRRINLVGCDIIIDDLPEVLLHSDLPEHIIKILYDPDGWNPPDPGYVTARSWDQMSEIIERLHGYLS